MSDEGGPVSGAGSGLIYCGLCGALNSASHHYCAACGTTLVDAFHATEGIRVFERADPAARVVDIVAAGVELEPVVGTQEVPADWVRVRLANGKLGFVRLSDLGPVPVSAMEASPLPEPNINTHARGCISSSAVLAALALLILTALIGLVIVLRARPEDLGVLWLVYCFALGPLLLLTIGIYVGARMREDRIADDAESAD
ncbi:MAG: hypothetical protein ACKOD2_01595 [Ilumatobacteraceae bacterium]